MKNKSKSKIIIISFFLLLIIGLVIFFFVKDSNRLTPQEKAWITESAKKVQNIHVINDENLFGKNGKGIFYTFIKDFEENYGISFNNIVFKSNETVSNALFGTTNTLPQGALDFYQDHYVLIGKEAVPIPSIEYIKTMKIGILSSNVSYINNYLKTLNLQIASYNTREELIAALDNKSVNAIIVPRIEYLDTLLEKNYVINFHFSDILYHYYMNDNENSLLKSVMQKYYDTWSIKNLPNNLAEEERTEFLKDLKLEEKDLASLQSNSISYGLVDNSPYEVLRSGHVGGIATEYMKAFAKFSKIDIEYYKYKNSKKLLCEIQNNKIQLYFNYFESPESKKIPTNIYLSYSVYIPLSSTVIVNTLDSLQNKKIYVEENTLLASELQKNNNLQIITYNREKDWNKIRNKNDTIIVIDSKLGNYFQNSDLKKFKKAFETTTQINYSFLSENNDTFNLLLKKYLNYSDNNLFQQVGIYNNLETEHQGNIISTIAKYAFYFLVIIGIILFLIFRNSKKVRLAKKIKKDDKLKYIDQLTTLKNRNYLNENMESWNKNTIYPQSVIMIDLTSLQEINDTLGYEEGDKQIQGAANILIRTQLDNSDIIRTDGTEFMIYLVGYSQKQITSYLHKLNKEFKNLPYAYGAKMSYSMILDDLKNIEDAINECVEEIKMQKQEQKEEKE